MDSGNIVKNVSIEKTIRTSDFIEKYSYGLFVDLTGKNQIGAILNSGIKLYDTDVDDVCRLIFNIDSRKIRYLNRFFLFNFPSNYLNIDVSKSIPKILSMIAMQLFSSLFLTKKADTKKNV